MGSSSVQAKPSAAKHSTLLANNPKFHKEQRVRFLGGTGNIKTYQPAAGRWIYEIEMELGPQPPMGRVGPETRILLCESDIQGVLD